LRILAYDLIVKEYTKLQDEGKWKRLHQGAEDTEDTAGKRMSEPILSFPEIFDLQITVAS
jgi:hypothetical protein